ncbi:MAG: pyruvate kinase [Clostridia bacterium]|nr:pyruvate kinase [Clostridia bacterium]
MRKTKIICTLGPASNDEATIEKLMLSGMNVARINFSHGSHEEHLVTINKVKQIRKKLNLPVAIMADTKGPEYRIGLFENGKETLEDGDTFTFTADDVLGTAKKVSVSYKELAKELSKGDRVLVNNGLLIFEVTETIGNDVVCKVISGGVISNRKSMSFPGKVLKQSYISKQDREDFLFGIENDVDYFACSFVSNADDIRAVKTLLAENGGSDISLIAKIENRSGIDNIESICAECDGIMIGRGDMGVEVPFEELPAIQKHLITKCRLLGKRVITATEMLESMIYNPRPTRAEISDVANAVYDGTSAVMLSGETAAGKFPVLTLETMARIVEQTEKSINYGERFFNSNFRIKNHVDAISHSVCNMSIDLAAKAIVICSMSGTTARMVSRFRPPVDIIGISVKEKTWHQLALSWGVTPLLCEVYPSVEVLFYTAEQIAKETFGLSKGDTIIMTAGTKIGESGNTNSIRVAVI